MISGTLAATFKEVPEILEEAELQDGETLSEEEVAKAIKPLFWLDGINSKNAAKKPINVIYTVRTVRHRGRADGNPAHPNVQVGIDAIVLKKSIADVIVTNTIATIETAFAAHGYQFEAEASMSSDLDAERSILSFTESKTN